MKKFQIYLLSILLILIGCSELSQVPEFAQVQSIIEELTPEQKSIVKKQIVQRFEQPAKILKSKPLPLLIKTLELVKEHKLNLPPTFKLLRLYIAVPRDPTRTLEDRGFTVKALPVNSIVKIKAALSGIGITSPIQPQGVDANGFLPVPADGVVVIDFAAPVGVKRVVSLDGFTSIDRLVDGSNIKGVLDIEESQVSTTNIHYMTTPTASVVDQLLIADPLMASLIDVSALQSFVDTQLTNPSSTTPPISFQRHPSLVNADAIFNEIQTLNAGNPPGTPVVLPATPTASMTIDPVTLTGTVFTGSGYNNIDITITAFDPASDAPGFSFTQVYDPADLGSKTIPFSIAGLAPNEPGKPWTVKLAGTLTGSKFFSGEVTQTVDLTTTTQLSFFVF